jgi:hypothetical protein
MPPSPRPFFWNERALRYVGPNGRFVSRVQVRNAIDSALDNAARRMRQQTQLMRERKISVRRWELDMKREIKNIHLYSAASARGGWAELTQSELGRVGYIVGEQYGYLERFARDLRTGKIPRDGRVLGRADMYAQAGRRTYHVTDERLHLARGYKQERSFTTADESCSSCIAEQGRGFVPIGSLVPIGQRTCLARCKCYIEYKE